jgi:hypothetical protein
MDNNNDNIDDSNVDIEELMKRPGMRVTPTVIALGTYADFAAETEYDMQGIVLCVVPSIFDAVPETLDAARTSVADRLAVALPELVVLVQESVKSGKGNEFVELDPEGVVAAKAVIASGKPYWFEAFVDLCDCVPNAPADVDTELVVFFNAEGKHITMQPDKFLLRVGASA